jgi:hypothetical protein
MLSDADIIMLRAMPVEGCTEMTFSSIGAWYYILQANTHERGVGIPLGGPNK